MSDRRAVLSRGAFLVGCFALLGTGGCKTVGFKEVFMSSDSGGKRKTKTFPTQFLQDDSGIFCQISYSSGRDDAELKIYVTAPTEDFPATLVNGDSIILSKGDDGKLTVQLAVLTETTGGKALPEPKGPWTAGSYTLDFYIDNKKEDSISFTVEEPQTSDAPPG